ncbi:hypothetical protein ACLIBH_06085 [Virgibacillus sp. W0430]|uniref:hypothetical protein n=1 Tax=Virgibacillus sp. W0430 TaxID=3391580 RepID=UPI003F47D0DB
MRNRRTKFYIIISIVLLCVSALIYSLFYFNMIRPLAEKSDNLMQEVEIYEKQVTKLKKQKNELDEEPLSEITLQVPIEKTPDTVLRQLEEHAKKTNVNIIALETKEENDDVGEKEASERNIEQMEYEIEITATNLTATHSFLEAILKAERFFTIEAVEIEQQGEQVEAVLTVVAYYMEAEE